MVSPWYVAEVRFTNCDRPSWSHPMHVGWFHNPRVTQPGISMRCSQNNTLYVENVGKLVQHVMDSSPTHFPRGRVDQIYAVTFVLQITATIAVLIASLAFAFRLVKPDCLSQGMKFLSVGVCMMAFVFSVSAVCLFSMGLPVSEANECLGTEATTGGRFQNCVRGDMAVFFDSSSYKTTFRRFNYTDSERRLYEYSTVSSFHPGHGWVIAAVTSVVLFVVTLLSLIIHPPLGAWSWFKTGNTEEKMELLS